MLHPIGILVHANSQQQSANDQLVSSAKRITGLRRSPARPPRISGSIRRHKCHATLHAQSPLVFSKGLRKAGNNEHIFILLPPSIAAACYKTQWRPRYRPIHCTETVKLTGTPGLTKAVAVHAFGSDSVPSAICAVAPKECEPLFNVSAALLPVIPALGPLAPAGAAIENNFTGAAPGKS